MKSVSTKTPFGETIFCDDIREEARGKLSLMGVYAGSLILNRPFPASLPKFSLFVSYNERPGESSEPVELRVYLPGDDPDKPTLKGNVPVDALRKIPHDQKLGGEDVRITIRNTINFTPLNLKQEGFIRVRAYRGNLEIRMGSIFVTSSITEETKPPEAPPAKKPAKKKRTKSKKPAK